MRIHSMLGVAAALCVIGLTHCGRIEHSTISHIQAQAATDTRNTQSVVSGERDAKLRSAAWLNVLKDSTSAHVKLHAHRTVTRRPVTDLDAPPTLVSRVAIEAEAVMKPDSHFVVVKDDDPAQMRKIDSPALVLSFQNGEVKEKLWYPGFQQYRTQEYKAPLKWGANDTKYEHGCQVGTFLQTWLGESDIRDMFKRGFEIAQVRGEQMINGHPCLEYYLDWEKVDPLVEIGKEKRVASYFFDATGHLRRWTTLSRIVMSSELIETEQVKDYEFAFGEGNKPTEMSFDNR